jgi:hypothetical protein
MVIGCGPLSASSSPPNPPPTLTTHREQTSYWNFVFHHVFKTFSKFFFFVSVCDVHSSDFLENNLLLSLETTTRRTISPIFLEIITLNNK